MARSRRTAAIVIAAAAFLLSTALAQGHPQPDHAAPQPAAAAQPALAGTQAQLRQVRRAVRRYRDVEAAKAAGYAAEGECASDPKHGGMG
jgi:hypothetical protein